MESYVQTKAMNQTKNKTLIRNAVDVYKDYMSVTWHVGQCLHPEDLISEHNIAKCRALIAYKPSKTCTQGYDINDEDEVLLIEMIESKYQDLLGINDTANQAAVQEALVTFKAVVQDRLSFSWWWLLLIPAIQTLASIPKYFNEATQAAHQTFRAKRRPGHLYIRDPYLDQLNSMISDEIHNVIN